MKNYLLIAAIAGGLALIFAAVATSTLTLAPQFNLRFIEPIICSPGQTLEYQESAPYTYTDAEGTHRRANISIACVAADGTRVTGKETATIGTLMGIYFLLCFVPLLGLAVLFRWSLLRRYKGVPS